MPAGRDLLIGTRLGPYEITAFIGAGGMGEVYCARDTRLGRTVAIKIVREHLEHDSSLPDRFQREARILSSLNHPHICAIYDVGRDAGVDYLVMEYLEGQTLDRRLASGSLTFDEAMTWAIEIADALDTAHSAGITHRDLKPANVMLTRGGANSTGLHAKLLDFGLAKQMRQAVAVGDPSTLPTAAADATREGAILGTLQYMAPEQVEGREADVRTDIFAFGAVWYEMLTGRRAFKGESGAGLIGAILRDEPAPVSSVRPIPPSLDRVVRKCLDKRPERRWQSARDLRDEMAWLVADATATKTAGPAVARGVWRERAAWAVAVAVGLAAAAWIVGSRPAPAADAGEETRLELATPGGSLMGFAISPDGRMLAYQATIDGRSQIWVRPLATGEARPLDGTDGASGFAPFWSPDSQSIGFFAGNGLKRIDLAGGPVRTVVAQAPGARGATWGSGGTILYNAGSSGSLYSVPASGGDPVVVTEVQRPRQTGHRFPHFLPDGRRFLFYSLGTPDARGVYVGTLGTSEVRRLFDAETAAVFAPPNHVLFGREGALWAQRVDARDFTVIGEPQPVSKQLAWNADIFGNIALAEAAPQVIAYRPRVGLRQLVWFDRTGKRNAAVGEADASQPAAIRLSRDDRTIALRRTIDGNTDIWSIDTARATTQRLTVHGTRDYDVVWSPDGKQIAFSADRDGVLDLYVKSVAGSSDEARVLSTSEHKNLCDWSEDGRFLLYGVQNQERSDDLWAVELSGDRRPIAIAQTPFAEQQGRFSPDGRWVAYQSTESGRSDIYIQSFPDGKKRTQVSPAGGTSPQWRRDGRELFFHATDGRLMAVPLTPSREDLEPGQPVPLFSVAPGPNRGLSTVPWYAASADGQRFLIDIAVQESSPIAMLLNWKPK